MSDSDDHLSTSDRSETDLTEDALDEQLDEQLDEEETTGG